MLVLQVGYKGKGLVACACTYQCHEEEAKRRNFYFNLAGTSFQYGAVFENQTKSDITIGGEVLVEERHRREEVERCWWGRDIGERRQHGTELRFYPIVYRQKR